MCSFPFLLLFFSTKEKYLLFFLFIYEMKRAELVCCTIRVSVKESWEEKSKGPKNKKKVSKFLWIIHCRATMRLFINTLASNQSYESGESERDVRGWQIISRWLLIKYLKIGTRKKHTFERGTYARTSISF